MRKVLLPPADVQERLQLSSREMAVRLMRTTPLLRAYKIGRLWRVDESDFEAWLESLKGTQDPYRLDRKLSPTERRLKGKAY